jgi:siroheme synthase-like protein
VKSAQAERAKRVAEPQAVSNRSFPAPVKAMEPNSMRYYPIYLDMRGRRCVVIGGGVVAERKVLGLLSAGVSVTVISPEVTHQLSLLLESGKIKHEPRNYLAGDLGDADIAFVATDDGAVNEAVYQEGKRRRIWVNAADDPTHCDFILPSVLRRGELVIALSTGGQIPALARAIREELEGYFPENFASLVNVAAEVRVELRRRSITPTYELWRKAFNGAVRAHLERGDLARAKELLLDELGAKLCD